MSLGGTLEPAPGGARHVGRHEVVDAILVRGEERIPVVVKKTALDWRQRLRRPKGRRSFETARQLLRRGLPTPEPLGWDVDGTVSRYLARKLEHAPQIREWFLHRDDASWPAPSLPIPFEEVVRALGRLARAMHDGGVFFRDFTDGNVLVTSGTAGEPRLWLVDLNRARLSERPVPLWRRLRDLARPGLNRPDDTRLLLGSYFEPRPAPEAAFTAVRLLRRRVVLWDDFKLRARPWRRRSGSPR